MQIQDSNRAQSTKATKNNHGGSRPGAGRKNIKGEGYHQKRPRLGLQTPIYLEYLIREDLPSLRRAPVLEAISKAAQAARAFGFRIVAYHVDSNSLRLVVECFDNATLTRGIKSFAIRLAKAINKERRLSKVPRQGSVFRGRYKIQTLSSRKQVFEAYAQMFSTHTKTQKLNPKLAKICSDAYSSALFFHGWHELLGPQWKKLVQKPLPSMIEKRQQQAAVILSPAQYPLHQFTGK